jgi:hypothetical protein
LRHRRLGENLPLKRYHYGLRICPEPVYWGGLSGSPYSEAVSWGKFVPPAEGGKFGEVFVDATVGLPIIVAAVLERLDKAKKGGNSRKGAIWAPADITGTIASETRQVKIGLWRKCHMPVSIQCYLFHYDGLSLCSSTPSKHVTLFYSGCASESQWD